MSALDSNMWHCMSKDGRAHGVVHGALGSPAVGPRLLLVDFDQPWNVLANTHQLDGEHGAGVGSRG